jgi:dipeptidyl aminopeptidase/acylaminoacyl peptidase
MISRLSAVWLFLLAFLAFPAAAAAPVEAYGRLPSIEQAALSPGGSKIAFIQTTADWHVLAIYDLSQSKMIDAMRVGDQKIRAIEWADDDHLLLTTASSQMPMELTGERVEWHLMRVYNLKSKKLTTLLEHVRGGVTTMNVVYGRPVVQQKDGETLLYVQGIYVQDRTEKALFRVNLTSGSESVIRQGGDATQEWLVDDNGEIVAEQDYWEQNHEWAIRLFHGGRVPQTVSGIAAVDPPDMLGLSATGDAVVVALTETGGVSWKPLMIKDGTWGPEISANESLSDLVLKDGSESMIGTGFVGDTTRYHFVDPALQEGWDWTTRVFRFQRAEFVSASADHSRIIAKIMGPKAGYGYYLADVKERYTQTIGNIYDGVAQIAEVRPLKYAAADGLEIPAYLTLPPDRPAKNLPVIVLPHGGPQARDTLGFDWWAQALAAQGYAVLQPNFRGSDLGQEWIARGYGEWGRKMQTDLSDGLSYLAAQGIGDPKRACIVGASYGGYAALAGVALQSDIYRCAVAVAGISDLGRLMQWVMRKEAYGDKLGLRYWERFLGVTNPDDRRLDAISPLKHADQIKVPLLLIHGRDDTTVPYDQSADLAKALKNAVNPVEFVTLDKEDHYLSRGATRLQMLRSSVEFLRKYNPPD